MWGLLRVNCARGYRKKILKSQLVSPKGSHSRGDIQLSLNYSMMCPLSKGVPSSVRSMENSTPIRRDRLLSSSSGHPVISKATATRKRQEGESCVGGIVNVAESMESLGPRRSD